jgi:hypothetical protein
MANQEPHWTDGLYDDPADIPFRELLGPPISHEQLAAAYRQREHFPALLAAAGVVVELWDRWMATSSPDRPSIRDLDAAIDALRPSSAPWYAD